MLLEIYAYDKKVDLGREAFDAWCERVRSLYPQDGRSIMSYILDRKYGRNAEISYQFLIEEFTDFMIDFLRKHGILCEYLKLLEKD